MKRVASSEEVIVENSDAPLDLTVKKKDRQQQRDQREPLLRQGIFISRECQMESQGNDSFVKHKQNYCASKTEQQQQLVVVSKAAAAAVASSGGQEQSSSDKSSGYIVWRCNFCHTISSSFDAIWSHQLKHSELKRYLCNECGFSCKDMRDMWLHADFHSKEGSMIVGEFIRKHVRVDFPISIPHPRLV